MPRHHAILPVKDVNQQQFIRRFAHYLKKSGKIVIPDWIDCVKTGYFKELPPNNSDWLYVRMASVIRRVYMRCPSGVGALSRRYGGRNRRRGVRPNHTAKASKKIIRHCLQECERLGWMKKMTRGGRKLTFSGQIFVDSFVGRVPRTARVDQYWKRRSPLERKKRRAKFRAQLEKSKKAVNVTAGENIANDDGTKNEQQTEFIETNAEFDEQGQP